MILRKERAIIKKVNRLLFTILLMFIIAMPVHAMDFDLSDAVIDADGDGLVIINDPLEETSYFVKVKNILPGDTLVKSYIIKNTYKGIYSLSLRAENPRTTPDHLDLVSKISLKLTLDGVVVYDGDIIGETDKYGNSMVNNIPLGNIAPGDESLLTAEFHFDGPSITNEYQKAKAEVDWIFHAIRTEEPETIPPATEPPTEEPTTENPTDTSSTKPTRGSDRDSGTSGGNKGPKTGDEMKTDRMMLLILLSFSVIMSLMVYKKKHNLKV